MYIVASDYDKKRRDAIKALKLLLLSSIAVSIGAPLILWETEIIQETYRIMALSVLVFTIFTIIVVAKLTGYTSYYTMIILVASIIAGNHTYFIPIFLPLIAPILGVISSITLINIMILLLASWVWWKLYIIFGSEI